MAVSARAIDIVRLIATPQSSSQVHDLSEELQAIQASPEGWQVADDMLKHEDFHVRFYGALTMQIKLNKEANQLSAQAADEISNRIILWIVQLTSRGEKRLVLDKLCSTIATFFIQSPFAWRQALRQIVCSLYTDQIIHPPQLQCLASTYDLIRQMPYEKQMVVVSFCQTLAEDMFSWANVSQQHPHLNETFKDNAAEAASIMRACFALPIEDHVLIQAEALDCFTAWTTFAHTNWSSDPVTLELLQNITPKAAKFLLSDIDGLREPATELFVNLLEYRKGFFKSDHLQYISQLVRQEIGPKYLATHQGLDQEPAVVAMGKLTAAYGKVALGDVIARRGHDSSEDIVALFLNLLTKPGYPGEDDQLIISATEFWNDYSERVGDLIIAREADTLPTWLPPLKEDLMKALQAYLPKLAPPPTHIRNTWDEESFQTWKFFRSNVADFLETIVDIPNTSVFEHLVTYAVQILGTKEWLNLEAVIFCINAIGEQVNLADVDATFSILMGSSIFSDASDNSNDVPVVLRRAVLAMIDQYSPFIRSNPAYIPPVLTFLFTILETTPAKDNKVADQAAKSFESLCSSCRRALTSHLDELLQQCPRALSGPSANPYQKEKIMSALASIVQALPNESTKAAPLTSLIQVVEIDLNAAVQAIQAGNIEIGEALGTAALQCLANIGKGIQAPDDITIEISSDDESGTSKPPTLPASQTFWTTEAGAPIQARILACFEIVSYLPNAGDAIEAACVVLRSGLAETQPGPFVFPPSATVSFISKASLQTPRIEAVLSTACTFVAAHSRRNSPHLFDEILTVYQSVARVVAQLGDPSNDPQLAQLCIDFLQRLLSAYLDVLLAPNDSDVAAILTFAISCMTGEAPMLKRCACNFFETLIGLGRPNNPSPLPQTRVPIATVLTHFAPLIARSLMQQLCGIAQRSELDALCKPLRAFVFGLPNAKAYLEDALGGDAGKGVGNGGNGVGVVGGEGTITLVEKRVFLKKVLALRGSRQTNVVVREFWAKCKGTVSRFD